MHWHRELVEKRSGFHEIKCRIGQKLAGWKASTLLVARKVVLIRSNLTSIPQYFMNCSKFLKSICNDIDNMNRNFFWKDNFISSINKNRLPTLVLDKIYRPKSEDVLGTRRVEDANAVFLAKQD